MPGKNKVSPLKTYARSQSRSGHGGTSALEGIISLQNINTHFIDGRKGIKLAAERSLDKDFDGAGGNIAAAKAVGAER